MASCLSDGMARLTRLSQQDAKWHGNFPALPSPPCLNPAFSWKSFCLAKWLSLVFTFFQGKKGCMGYESLSVKLTLIITVREIWKGAFLQQIMAKHNGLRNGALFSRRFLLPKKCWKTLKTLNNFLSSSIRSYLTFEYEEEFSNVSFIFICKVLKYYCLTKIYYFIT